MVGVGSSVTSVSERPRCEALWHIMVEGPHTVRNPDSDQHLPWSFGVLISIFSNIIIIKNGWGKKDFKATNELGKNIQAEREARRERRTVELMLTL